MRDTEVVTVSSIEDKVCAKIQARAELGKRKYGTTMERDDLTGRQWLTHLQEELMDAVVYIQKIIDYDWGLIDYSRNTINILDKSKYRENE